jgi:hypothetical protein|tara:strand:- start:702 stop:833 length:132 start_codon:yes stop_codon:yes gene_type:complete
MIVKTKFSTKIEMGKDNILEWAVSTLPFITGLILVLLIIINSL